MQRRVKEKREWCGGKRQGGGFLHNGARAAQWNDATDKADRPVLFSVASLGGT